MRLLLLHPLVATRDCQHCLKFLYDEKTGQPIKSRVQGLRARDRSCPPPCRVEKLGCAKGTPEKPRSLSERNLAAYEHYLECRATGCFPDDPIVRRNAAVIRSVEDAVELDQKREHERLLLAVVAARG